MARTSSHLSLCKRRRGALAACYRVPHAGKGRAIGMRTIVRVCITIGGVGFVALFALQAVIALAVADCLLIVGLAAGLATAKWLERPWFGRQLIAGLRAGALAVGIAGAGALFSLFIIGP